jgi:membrane protease subunit HflC
MRRVILMAISAVVVLVLVLVLCTYVKRPYEKVLLTRFGSLVEEKDQTRIAYNWYLKWPTDSVVRFDNRLHLYTGGLVEATTANSEPISVQAFAAWRIVDPKKFYTMTGGSDKKAEQMIEAILKSLVQGSVPAHTLDEFFNSDEAKIHTAKIEDDIARSATDDIKDKDGTVKTPGLGSMGIQIAEIGFSRIAFPPNNATAVYERMVAELSKKAVDYQAQGLAEANNIVAEGKLAAAKAREEATREAAAIMGKADAEALKVLADVQKTPQAMEFYQYWKSLEFVKTSLAKNTVLVLSSNSDILKAVFHIPAKEGTGATAGTKGPAEELGIIPGAMPAQSAK